MNLKIIYLSPDELTPYEGNARKHAPEDIDQIKASIEAAVIPISKRICDKIKEE